MMHNEWPWYAVRTKSKFEQVTANMLRHKGYEEFLPTYLSRRRWSDRTKTIAMPLFPGYVFCRFDCDNRLPVLTVPGVVSIVSFGKTLAPIPDEEVTAIQKIVKSESFAEPWPFLQVGERILVERGPLAGIEGILINIKGNYRLIASVNMLHRSVAVEIDRDWVRPLAAQSRPINQPMKACLSGTVGV